MSSAKKGLIWSILLNIKNWYRIYKRDFLDRRAGYDRITLCFRIFHFGLSLENNLDLINSRKPQTGERRLFKYGEIINGKFHVFMKSPTEIANRLLPQLHSRDRLPKYERHFNFSRFRENYKNKSMIIKILPFRRIEQNAKVKRISRIKIFTKFSNSITQSDPQPGKMFNR